MLFRPASKMFLKFKFSKFTLHRRIGLNYFMKFSFIKKGLRFSTCLNKDLWTFYFTIKYLLQKRNVKLPKLIKIIKFSFIKVVWDFRPAKNGFFFPKIGDFFFEKISISRILKRAKVRCLFL